MNFYEDRPPEEEQITQTQGGDLDQDDVIMTSDAEKYRQEWEAQHQTDQSSPEDGEENQ